MKKLRYIGSSLDDLKNFPAEAGREAGFELDDVHRGAMPVDFNPLLARRPPARMRFASMRWASGVVYVAKFDDAVYVLHAFHKKTQKKRREDYDTESQQCHIINAYRPDLTYFEADLITRRLL